MDVWPRCLERLEAELPAEDVHTWLKPLQAGSREDGFVLYAPNAFVMEEVRSRYLARIQELLAHFAGSPEVSLEIGSMRRPGSGTAAAPTPAAASARTIAAQPFQGNLDNHYTSTISWRAAATSSAAPRPGRLRRSPATAPTTPCSCTAAPGWARPT